MSLDEPTLGSLAAPGPEAAIKVMTRIMRLPTTSLRQARSIVALQLDRLSPLPAAETLHDVVELSSEGGEGVYAVGVIRRRELQTPPFDARPVLVLTREVEGRSVTFRFRNAGAVGDAEQRLLKRAPSAFMIALGVAAFSLSLNLKTREWREARLPQIAAESREINRASQEGTALMQARQAWSALDRHDAATRVLCLSSLLPEQRGRASLLALRANSESVTLTAASPDGAEGLARAVGATPAGADVTLEGGCG